MINETFLNMKMNGTRFKESAAHIREKMLKGLSGKFQYHNLDHVMDVLDAAIRLGEMEGISDHEMELLKVAVMYHDAGYIKGLKDHESLSCEIVREQLPGFGYTMEEIEIICGLIMATKIPQTPETKLQQIICDADLDYLGRDDFFEIGDNLFLEFRKYGLLTTEAEWQAMQQRFLENHAYFTDSAKRLRDAKKQENLEKVKGKTA
jgi:predicted metal-dependent HD superfamily phosphohydrolase